MNIRVSWVTDRRTGMRLYAVVFTQCFVKVQLSAIYADVHTAVVKG